MVKKEASLSGYLLLTLLIVSALGQVTPFFERNTFDSATLNGIKAKDYSVSASVDMRNGEHNGVNYGISVIDDTNSRNCGAKRCIIIIIIIINKESVKEPGYIRFNSA